MNPIITTDRLRLVACDAAIFEALLAGKTTAATVLEATIPSRWTAYGNAPIRYAYDKIRQDPTDAGWWTYLPIYKPDNILIGTSGYKGKPDWGSSLLKP